MSSRRSDVLVVIPAYNEERNIGAVLRSVQSLESPPDVVVVNDGSVDRTEEVARQHGARVLSLPLNLGIGGAVQTGFRYAVAHGYRYAVQLDGDGQHDPRAIEDLLRPVRQGQADIVIGSRYVTRTGYRAPLSRRIGMVILARVISALVGRPICDSTSGFRAYNREAFTFLASHYPTDYPEPEAIVLLARNGFRILEVPVQMHPRLNGESSINSARSIYYMVKVLLAVIVEAVRDRLRSKEATSP
ncbi:MAG: glycosyltransferase family 2 protein [candidate division KSB1 bacterium]|nr:glycosyltransferase family 2 protein [candidate division KSB1 bacterium]